MRLEKLVKTNEFVLEWNCNYSYTSQQRDLHLTAETIWKVWNREKKKKKREEEGICGGLQCA